MAEDITTIKLPKKLKEELDLIKYYETEPVYNVVKRLIEENKQFTFVYLDLKNKDEKIINFSDDFKQKYEENLKKVAKKIEISQSFQKISNQGNKCNCDYYKFCKIL